MDVFKPLDAKMLNGIIELSIAINAHNIDIYRSVTDENLVPPPALIKPDNTLEFQRRHGRLFGITQEQARLYENNKRELMNLWAELFYQLGMEKEWAAIRLAFEIMRKQDGTPADEERKP